MNCYKNFTFFDTLGTLAPLDIKSSKNLDFARITTENQECKGMKNMAPLLDFFGTLALLKKIMRLGKIQYRVAYFFVN